MKGFNFRLFLSIILFTGFSKALLAQTTCTINATVSWSTCTCVETGLAPVNGNKIVVSSGRTLTIDVSSPTPIFTGNFEINGTLYANKSGAQINGNIRIFSGGTLDLNKQLNLGASGGCGYTVIIDSGGSLVISGAGGSALLSICGQGVAQAGGGCSIYPTGAPPYCTPGGGWPSTGFVFDETGNAGINYIWNGATSNWTTSANWTPTRTTLTTDDILTFNATGTNKNITSVSTQSVGNIIVTGSATYSFVNTATSTLTLTSVIGNALRIDNGATLSIGNGSFPVNITLPTNGFGEIGGQLILVNGNLAAGSSTLTLHTNSAPLARTAGQVSLNSSSVLNFGSASLISGSTIVLPNSIFVSAPTISSLVVNRTNGATLGDQSITVNNSATFTLGDFNTNGAGRLRFGTSATNPTETAGSKIVGYAEMLSRSVTTGAVDFLGFSLGSGVNNVGTVNIVRRTGTGGINTFNSNQSIASSWDVISTAEPVSGRSLVFRWVPSFDNITTFTNQFQDYIFSSGPGWTPLGALQNLTATSPLRQTASVTTTKLTDTFTVTDQTQILPIELISFSIKLVDNGAELEWSTASELNNDFFTVERTSNLEEFEKISFVEGQGTVKSKTNYSFVDESPLPGTSYYRLKQTDFDGKFTYSSLRKIEYSISGTQLNVYPNPIVNNKFNFELIGVQPGEVAPVRVVNLQGASVYNASFKADGSGKILTTIELDRAPSGVYMVIVNASTGLRKKIVIP